jgi:hypothetical protein
MLKNVEYTSFSDIVSGEWKKNNSYSLKYVKPPLYSYVFYECLTAFAAE